jgi:hypothetical protein
LLRMIKSGSVSFLRGGEVVLAKHYSYNEKQMQSGYF